MVIFTGGSWGIGHWTNNELTGPGVAQYFSFTDVTLNLCQSGDSNLDQLKKLKDLLHRFRVAQTDKVYWLVHNPIVNEPVEKICVDQSSLSLSIEKVLHEQLSYANELAQQNNFYIELVGASCDLNSVDMSNYPHLYVKVPSWGQLLDSTYPASIFSHQADHMQDLKQYIETHRPELVEEYNRIGGQAFGKRRTMLKLNHMFSSFHPTSLAHKKLKDFLIN